MDVPRRAETVTHSAAMCSDDVIGSWYTCASDGNQLSPPEVTARVRRALCYCFPDELAITLRAYKY